MPAALRLAPHRRRRRLGGAFLLRVCELLSVRTGGLGFRVWGELPGERCRELHP